MKTLLSIVALLSLSNLSSASAKEMKDIPWSWVPVGKGSVEIVTNDWIDLAVIHDDDGVAEFNRKYGAEIQPSPDLLTSNVIIVVFTRIGLGVDGFAQSRRDEFCIDVFDLGIDVETVKPPPGKAHPSLHVISVPKEVAKGTVYIRLPQVVNRKDFKKD